VLDARHIIEMINRLERHLQDNEEASRHDGAHTNDPSWAARNQMSMRHSCNRRFTMAGDTHGRHGEDAYGPEL
jgi:hypothetical protein